MSRRNLIFLLFILIVFACNSIGDTNDIEKRAKETGCISDDPVKDFQWLKEMVENKGAPCPVHTICSGIYEGNVVFMPDALSANCCGCGGYATFNCKGELLFSCDLDKSNKITDIKVIWKR
jgi:hypothetical protein